MRLHFYDQNTVSNSNWKQTNIEQCKSKISPFPCQIIVKTAWDEIIYRPETIYTQQPMSVVFDDTSNNCIPDIEYVYIHDANSRS